MRPLELGAAMEYNVHTCKHPCRLVLEEVVTTQQRRGLFFVPSWTPPTKNELPERIPAVRVALEFGDTRWIHIWCIHLLNSYSQLALV